jgi:hypothetical protein
MIRIQPFRGVLFRIREPIKGRSVSGTWRGILYFIVDKLVYLSQAVNRTVSG